MLLIAKICSALCENPIQISNHMSMVDHMRVDFSLELILVTIYFCTTYLTNFEITEVFSNLIECIYLPK